MYVAARRKSCSIYKDQQVFILLHAHRPSTLYVFGCFYSTFLLPTHAVENSVHGNCVSYIRSFHWVFLLAPSQWQHQ